MPKKIRQLIKMLEKADFTNRGGKGSHRNFFHEKGIFLTISGKLGDDAKNYQVKLVDQKMMASQKVRPTVLQWSFKILTYPTYAFVLEKQLRLVERNFCLAI